MFYLSSFFQVIVWSCLWSKQEPEVVNVYVIREEHCKKWQNAAQRTYHPLSRCQVVLTKRPFKDLSLIEFCHNWTFWVLSQFDFLSYHNLNFWVCHNMTFWFCHNMSFWVLPQLEFLSFVTISVVDFCHNLTFWFNSLQLFHYQGFI